MSGPEPIAAALTAARPKAIAALLRTLRDLDAAEDAFQEACLRALAAWPHAGLPRDPTAWLILVGRNAALDRARRRRRDAPLPADDALSDLGDAEAEAADQLDAAHYRDDVLRLLFICCHPGLPPAHQIGLALRVVSGLSVAQIARAFLIGEAAMEQRITRAKARIARRDVPYEAPGPVERAERLAAVAVMVYLVFNEGYSSADAVTRARFCGEAIRLGRILLRVFPTEPEIMGLLALMLLQHARAPARFDAAGETVLLDEQDRRRWNPILIAEGLALIHKADRHRATGPYQLQAAIAAVHMSASRATDTDWSAIDRLYAILETVQPSPVVTLNRAVAVDKCRGPAEALAMIEPLEPRLARYLPFFAARGAFLLELGRVADAQVAFGRAIGLARSPAEAAQVHRRLDRGMRDAAAVAH